MGKTIFLSAPTKSTRSTGTKFLDVLSSILLEPTTFIKDPVAAGKKVASRRAKISSGDRGEALNVLGETLTSTAIGAGLLLGGATVAGRAAVTRLAPKLIPKTVKGKIFGVTATGALLTSPSLRKFGAETIQDPTRAGREAGRLIEKAVKGEELPGFVDVLKTAGVVGLGVAGGVAAVNIVKKLRDGKDPSSIPGDPSSVPPSIALPGSGIPDSLAPLSAGPVVAETPKPAEAMGPQQGQDINIKVINKPQINLAMAQSS